MSKKRYFFFCIPLLFCFSLFSELQDDILYSHHAANGQNYVVQRTYQTIFTEDGNGHCWARKKVVAFCNTETCIFWQDNNDISSLSFKKIFKSINTLQKYINLGRNIMDYDPTTNLREEFTGGDGITRKWIIDTPDNLCSGYSGASYNGTSWNAIAKVDFKKLYNTIEENVSI
ncbi:MAG: hypothetical protein KC505_08620 [Myxococcales bacterium]|nr:hypothetical protein [Myxococcales bacterium]USN51636.1 MAG: hypothetical protein H6731_04290 [Myxococcales bacterium]